MFTYGVGFSVVVWNKGNTRALKSGTAIVQSRFYLYKREKIVQAKRDKNTFKDPLFLCIY